MDIEILKKLLTNLNKGRISVDEAINSLKYLPYEDLSFAKVDHHRGIRNNVPEVIFAKDKRIDDVVKIARAMYEKSRRFLITKASEDIYRSLSIKGSKFYPLSKTISYGESKNKKGLVAVISAGTSDIPVAEEVEVTLSFLGSKTESVYDIGVAGIHRLFSNLDLIKKARVIVVVAGMEGALPSVVGGLTDKPVIAVPTSVGYGTNLNGITPLFAMLNSCVPGLAVVNIDNGFGAGCLAHKINTLSCKK